MSGVPLGQLLPALAGLNPRGDTAPARGLAITGVEHDSRRCQPGSIFVCLSGREQDGHRFAPAAERAGAALIVGENPPPAGLSAAVYLQVDDARRALALLSATWFGHPSRSLTLTGVTGTNGKTSVTWMVHAIHLEAGWPSAVLGTLGAGTPGCGFEPARPTDARAAGAGVDLPPTDPYAGRVRMPTPPLASLPVRPGPHTTPEAPDLQRELARWRDAGIHAGACEISSHALELRRSYGTRFACVVFTNLTEDHLDFHGTMEAYRAAKARLFRRAERGPGEPPAVAIVPGDDPVSGPLLQGSDDAVLRFGRGPENDVRLLDATAGPGGCVARVRHPGGEVEIRTPLPGSFQIDNLLAAFAAATALGIDPPAAARGLARLRAVPGRLEPVDRGQPFRVIVDYAHTPDALRRAAAAVRPDTNGRLILVFGCGGDRDRDKRPRMGAVAAQAAEVIFVTDDNPRSEPPESIRAAILAGVEQAGGRAAEVEDRAEAIRRALREARSGDTVLIAGKGHETGQERGGTVLPFDDREVAARLLGELGHGSGGAAGDGTGVER